MKKGFKRIYNLAKNNRVYHLLFLKLYLMYRYLQTTIRYRRGQLHILHVGQVHSPHFKELNKKIRKFYADDGINQTSVLVCTYPYPVSRELNESKIYDWCNYCHTWWVQVVDFQRELYTSDFKFNANLIKKIKSVLVKENFDLIWIHDLQAGGYPLLEAMFDKFDQCPIVATTYGNDLYYFYDSPLHNHKLVKLLEIIDVLHIESDRDVKIAESLGFTGLITAPTSATFRNYNQLPIAHSDFKDIDFIVKGSSYLRSNFSDIYNIFVDLASELAGKKIYIFNASPEDEFFANKLKYTHGYIVHTCRHISREELDRLFIRSKFHITMTYSDGMSNTCVEAVAGKCIPLISVHNSFAEVVPSEFKNNSIFKFPLSSADFLSAFVYFMKSENSVLYIDSVNKNLCEYFSLRKYENIYRQVNDVLANGIHES